MTQTHKHRHIR